MPELLSPVGSMDHLYAAVNNGCDAVYLGGKNFNARASAQNFSDEQLQDAINYCHLRGVKVFIVVNTLYKNNEILAVINFIMNMYEYGADAFIFQDIGTAIYAKKYMPNIILHASTQLTAHSLEDVLYLEQMGFSRVVLSRELSMDEISYISQNSNIEIEVFVHGAICICFSGRCLLSSSLGKRSGNRGTCAQPCRLKYKSNQHSGYLLSPKDMMTLDILDELVECGVDSLKIEGRQKSSEYVALTTKAYREHLDMIKKDPKNYKPDEQTKKDLLSIFNRGGDFSSGYFKSYNASMSIKSPKNTGLLIGTITKYDEKNAICYIKTEENLVSGDGIEIHTQKGSHIGAFVSKNCAAGNIIDIDIRRSLETIKKQSYDKQHKKCYIKKGDLVYRTHDKQMLDCAKSTYIKDKRKLHITGTIYATIGQPILLKLMYKDICIEVSGETAQEPKNQAIDADDLIQRLSKMGDTTFSVFYEECICPEPIYLPISSLNTLRRKATEMLTLAIIDYYKREHICREITLFTKNDEVPNKSSRITVLVRTKEQFDAASMHKISRIYVEYSSEIISQLGNCINKLNNTTEIFIALPPVERQPHNYIETLEQSKIDGYLIRTYGQMWQLKYSNKKKVLDYHFNVMNSLSKQVLFDCGVQNITLSTELQPHEIKELYLSNIIQDFNGHVETVVYGKQALMTIQGTHLAYGDIANDKGINFLLVPEHNQQVTYLYKSATNLKLSDYGISRLEFLDETHEEVNSIIKNYID